MKLRVNGEQVNSFAESLCQCELPLSRLHLLRIDEVNQSKLTGKGFIVRSLDGQISANTEGNSAQKIDPDILAIFEQGTISMSAEGKPATALVWEADFGRSWSQSLNWKACELNEDKTALMIEKALHLPKGYTCRIILDSNSEKPSRRSSDELRIQVRSLPDEGFIITIPGVETSFYSLPE